MFLVISAIRPVYFLLVCAHFARVPISHVYSCLVRLSAVPQTVAVNRPNAEQNDRSSRVFHSGTSFLKPFGRNNPRKSSLMCMKLHYHACPKCNRAIESSGPYSVR
jgi:hypothetical protein